MWLIPFLFLIKSRGIVVHGGLGRVWGISDYFGAWEVVFPGFRLGRGIVKGGEVLDVSVHVGRGGGG
jgi:hypothetical protein